MAGAKDLGRVPPVFLRVQPHRTVDQPGRLPRVPGPDMAVEERIGVPQDLQVDPQKVRIAIGARSLNGLSEDGHALEKFRSLRSFQVGQLLGTRIVGEQNAITRQPLHVADHGITGWHLFEDCWIFTADCRTDTVSLPRLAAQRTISPRAA